jgi:hypothetical protein
MPWVFILDFCLSLSLSFLSFYLYKWLLPDKQSAEAAVTRLGQAKSLSISSFRYLFFVVANNATTKCCAGWCGCVGFKIRKGLKK